MLHTQGKIMDNKGLEQKRFVNSKGHLEAPFRRKGGNLEKRKKRRGQTETNISDRKLRTTRGQIEERSYLKLRKNKENAFIIGLNGWKM